MEDGRGEAGQVQVGTLAASAGCEHAPRRGLAEDEAEKERGGRAPWCSWWTGSSEGEVGSVGWLLPCERRFQEGRVHRSGKRRGCRVGGTYAHSRMQANGSGWRHGSWRRRLSSGGSRALRSGHALPPGRSPSTCTTGHGLPPPGASQWLRFVC
ncbi:uncharacterized protein LOC123449515 isoform X1 [Hordeum vulgare subsp. vulgare]|uniref:uncharacterized protein LOC123449515 isoform X1 n=1 Tax=Hordeum vulgare subsp. vulgare TaxID=112509 RepID=UPI001D1A4736|nr:uncharacterized protein LOC123449515 isoform X1 [Hordeum vulgare subsp. vulgare]